MKKFSGEIISVKNRPRTMYQNYLLAFGLSVAAGLLFVLPFSIANGGFYYLGSDFVEQQAAFWSYCNQAIKAGDIFWAQSMDLGTSFIGAFSFYVIGSPFFLFSLLFDPQAIPFLMGPLLLLKMGVCGIAAFAYLKRYVGVNSALMCSLLYTFCGYQISNMNFNHFYDVTAWFPFLLLALDMAMEEDKKFVFGFWVAVICMANIVFFPATVIFLVLYFSVKLLTKNYVASPKKIFRLAAESILGVGASGVLLLPTVYTLLSNPRVDGAAFESVWHMIALKPIYWAEIVRSSLFPAECIFDRGFYLQGFTNGAELYLPLFGLVLAAAFFIKNRKSWITILTLVCAVFAIIPILNSAFVLFNPEYYTRWYYMPILILILATAKCLEDTSISLKPGYIFYGAQWLALGVVAIAFIYFYKVTFIYNIMIAGVFALISLAGFVIVLFLRKIQGFKYGNAFLVICLIGCCAATGMINTYYHSRGRDPANVENFYTAPAQISLPESEEGYRIGSEYFFMNTGTMIGEPTVTTFSSTISGSAFEFYQGMNIPRSVISLPSMYDRAYHSALSMRYWVTLNNDPAIFPSSDYGEVLNQGDYLVGINELAIPMGYAYDYAITTQQMAELTDEQKKFALLKGIVLTDEQLQEYSDILPVIETAALHSTQEEVFLSDVEARQSMSAASFAYTNSGAISEITLEKDNLVFFSIPFDAGFTATVNGIPVEIEKVNFGLSAVYCNAGENIIEFKYIPPFFIEGIILSGISIGIALILFLLDKFSKTIIRHRK